MLNTFVSTFDTVAGRILGGAMILSVDHPIAMTLILAGLTGATCAAWADLVGVRLGASRGRPEAERPIRLRRW